MTSTASLTVVVSVSESGSYSSTHINSQASTVCPAVQWRVTLMLTFRCSASPRLAYNADERNDGAPVTDLSADNVNDSILIVCIRSKHLGSMALDKKGLVQRVATIPAVQEEPAIQVICRSWKLIVSDCFTVGKVAEISTVQTVALLGLFDFTAGRSRHGSAWVKVGLAVRIAQDCGLMLDNSTHLSYVKQEERRRVFWSVYLLDRLVSCGRGRPPAIVDASCHVQLPCDESIWREGLWVKTQSLDEITNRTLSVSQRQSPLAQVIAISHILGRCAQYVLQDFNIRGPHPPWDPGSDFAGIESDLLHFEAYLEIQRPVNEILSAHVSAEGEVDSQSTGPIIFSRALFHLCYCLLNHPFLLRRRINTCRNLAPISFIKRSSDLAWLHAQQMMSLIREARKLGCSFHSSSSGYAVTVAGSIIALRTYDEDPVAREQAQILLEEGLLYLGIIGQHWCNFRTMASTLRQIVYDEFSGRQLSSLTQSLNMTLVEEEAIWAVVDYNTMSNQFGEDALMSGQESDGQITNSWIDLFGPIDYAMLSDVNGAT
ncbi:hypothetical protein FSST1_009972 [Fusarium sambucinum]